MSRNKICFSLIVAFLLCAMCFATDVSGDVFGDWTVSNSPYTITDDVIVPAGKVLTIAGGVDVVFDGDFQMIVHGELVAVGTEADSIRFYGNGVVWDSIRLENTADTSLFEHCVITGGTIGINSIGSPFTLLNSRIGEMADKGVNVFGINNPAMTHILSSKIHNISGSGIFIVENSNVYIFGNEITRCSSGSSVGALQLSNQTDGGECSPIITRNHIHHNFRQGLTAFDVVGSGVINPLVEDNIIERNMTGIYFVNAQGVIINNQIRDNFISGDTNSGAGIMLEGATCSPQMIANNMLTGNFTGLYIVQNATIHSSENNIVYKNIDESDRDWSICLISPTDVTFTNNWFGTDDASLIATTIMDPFPGNVTFEPFITGKGVIYGEVKTAHSGILDITFESIDRRRTQTIQSFGLFQALLEPGIYLVKVSGTDWSDYYGGDSPVAVEVVEYTVSDYITINLDKDTSGVDVVVASPTVFSVYNYPNPFNPSTNIQWTVGSSHCPVASVQRVVIDIFNVRGQKVRSLVNGVFGAGVHSAIWNGLSDSGQSVGSGVYFYRVQAGDFVETKRMLLLK